MICGNSCFRSHSTVALSRTVLTASYGMPSGHLKPVIFLSNNIVIKIAMIWCWLALTYYLYALRLIFILIHYTPAASKTVKKAACTPSSEVQAAFPICRINRFPHLSARQTSPSWSGFCAPTFSPSNLPPCCSPAADCFPNSAARPWFFPVAQSICRYVRSHR